jgi:surface adhesion protein
VSLVATAAVAEGGAITYTASVGANPALSAFSVNLTNGRQILSAAGQTSGSVTVAAPADVYAGTPATQVAAIASLAGAGGGFESLAFNPAAVSTTVSQVTDITTVSLAATAAVNEGGSHHLHGEPV